MRSRGPAALVRLGMILASGPMLAHSALADAKTPPSVSFKARQDAKYLDRLPPIERHGRSWIDHSGRKQEGIASWYGPGFAGKPMANGAPMDPHANIAASKTLPLGTTARVVNLKNGKSVTVKIEDRGPFVDGRVVDVSSKAAEALGMKRVGVVPVVVKPIAVPLLDGRVKLGAGAAGLSLRQIEQATRTTKNLIGAGGMETASR